MPFTITIIVIILFISQPSYDSWTLTTWTLHSPLWIELCPTPQVISWSPNLLDLKGLTPWKRLYLELGPWGRWLRLTEVIRVGPNLIGLIRRKGHPRAHSPCEPGEKASEDQWEGNCLQASSVTTLTCWTGICSPQNCEKINLLFRSSCGLLLWWPELRHSNCHENQ